MPGASRICTSIAATAGADGKYFGARRCLDATVSPRAGTSLDARVAPLAPINWIVDILKPVATILKKIVDWEGMAQLVATFGDHPALGLIALAIPFVTLVLIVGMVCWTLVRRAKIRSEADVQLAQLTGVNPRKRWWQFWK
jgi:hypothetical protein